MPNGREGGSALSRPSRAVGASVLVAGEPSSEREHVLGHLGGLGHRVVVVDSLLDAIAAATNHDQDLVILVSRGPADVTDVCVALRVQFQNPVLVICSDRSSEATVAALDAGADDVMFAPVTASEFLARVEVALRYRDALTALASDGMLEVGALRIDLARRAAVINGESIELSPNEFHLLSVLAREAGTAVPAASIAALIWPEDAMANLNRLRICVTRLRKLLAGRVGGPLIVAERGVGYTLVLASPEG